MLLVGCALPGDLRFVPIQNGQLRHAQSKPCVGPVRPECQGALELTSGLLIAPLLVECGRKTGSRLGELRLQRQRAAIALCSVLVAAELGERQAAVVQCLGKGGLQRERMREMHNGLVELARSFSAAPRWLWASAESGRCRKAADISSIAASMFPC